MTEPVFIAQISEQVILALITSITGIIAGFITLFLKLKGVKSGVTEIHTTLNSRLDEWKKDTKEAALEAAVASYSRGVSDGKEGQIAKAETARAGHAEGLLQAKSEQADLANAELKRKV